MIKLILVLLVVGFLFAPMGMVLGILDNLSFSVFGIPLWGLIILGLLFFLFFLPRSKKKTNGKKSTNKKIMEGAALAVLAHKLIKKPLLNFKDPESRVVEEKICFDLSWDMKISYINNGCNSTSTKNITRNTRSSSFAGGFTVDWVDTSLEDLPESCRKIAYSALGIEN